MAEKNERYHVNRMGRIPGKALILFFLSVFAVSTAMGQEGLRIDDDESLILEEVVVTAEKRESTVQRTPIAIAAVKGADLVSKANFSLDQVIINTPAVEIQRGASGSGVYIRGVGTNDQAFGDPAINLNIDGVYQQDAGPVTGGLYDIDRVEVLRGPQGTLYGRNATAGSINIVTNDPVEKFEGNAGLTMGDYDLIRTEGMLNVPVADGIAMRGAFYTNRHDGYIQPSGYNDADQVGSRFKLLVDTMDYVRLLLSVNYLTENGEGIGAVFGELDERSDAWETDNLPGYINHEFLNVSARLDWDFGPATLTVIPAYVNAHRFDDIAIQEDRPVLTNDRMKQTTLEARIASNDSDSLTWVGGIYYLDGEFTRDDGGPYRLADPADYRSYVTYQEQPIESYAAFGQATFSLLDNFRLTGGLRYTNDSKEQHNTYVVVDTGVISVSPSVSNDSDSTDYKAGAELDLTKDSMLYATVSTAYKAGGFSTKQPIGNSPTYYDSEEIMAYELGVKNRFMAGSLQVNLGGYYYDYDNFQFKYPILDFSDGPPPKVTVVTENAETAEIYGGELESIYLFSPTDRLDVSLTYSHARFGTFEFVGPSGAVDLSDTMMPNAPEWTGIIGYQHTFEFSDMSSLTARVESKLSAEYTTTWEDVPDNQQDDYHKTNASLTYLSADEKWQLSGYVKNIEDEPVNGGGGQGFLYIQDPRTYGITVSANF